MRRVINKIQQVTGNVVRVRTTGVGNEELAEITSRHGTSLDR